MTEQTIPLITFYQGWETYQRNLIEMLAPLTPEQLALPAGSHQWTIGMVAQHIAGNRVWWFQVWMGEGSPDLAPIAHWDPADEVKQAPLDAAELVAGFEATWRMISDALSRWTPADLEQVFDLPAALREDEREFFSPSTRQWIIWHVLEHEIHHGGELSFALGAYGLPGIYGSR
ncbi:MAG TPA: DinB family protein [Ktedonobacterales bacterium]